jgi:hypothetical protein
MVVMSIAVAAGGCGPTQTTPHQWHGASGIVPNREDKDAGLVGVASGFDIRRYASVVIDRCTVVESEIRDAEDRELARAMTAFLQGEMARRLEATGLFERVVNLGESPQPAAPEDGIRVECVVTQLTPGVEIGRAHPYAGGSGRTKAEAEFRFVDAQTGSIVMVTADRRVAVRGRSG